MTGFRAGIAMIVSLAAASCGASPPFPAPKEVAVAPATPRDLETATFSLG